MKFIIEPAGVWVTPNAHRNEHEPSEVYAAEWFWGPGKTSMHGRLVGRTKGRDPVEFWRYAVYWHPETGEARLAQFGANGTFGEGTLRLAKKDVIRSEQTFHYPGIGGQRIAHDLIQQDGETHVTDSFDWDGRQWVARRHYVWKREAAARPSSAARANPPGRMIDVGGMRLHLRCVGDGSPTVVLDGGAGVWSIHYAHIQESVARGGVRVCTYDRAGFGWSDAGPRPRTSGRMADELYALLQKAGIEPPLVLVGHSLGGYNVRIYQARHPEEVAALVLVESAHEKQWQRLPPIVGELVQGAVAALRERADAARCGKLADEQIEIDPVFDGPARAWREAYIAAAHTPDVYLTTADTFEAAPKSASEVQRWPLGDLPLVVLTARNSFGAFAGTPIPVDESNRIWMELQADLATLSSNATHVFSERGDHNLHHSDPSAFAGAIERAVAAARARR